MWKLWTHTKWTTFPYSRGDQYVDRDLPVDLKGTVVKSHDINIVADSIKRKSSQ